MSDFESVIQEASELASQNQTDYIIYENEGSSIDNEFVISKSSYGTPTEYPSIDRTFRILCEIFYDEDDIRVNVAPNLKYSTGAIKSQESDDLENQSGVYEGRCVMVIFDSGEVEKTKVSNVSKTQIQTSNGMKFKKSDYESGWGSEPAKLDLDVESYEDPNHVPSDQLLEIEKGDELLLSNDKRVMVEEITKRQIRTTAENFKKSDGEIWGSSDEDVFISKII